MVRELVARRSAPWLAAAQPTGEMVHDVFISYSSHDKVTADAVCPLLEARGVRCWIEVRLVVATSDFRSLPGDSEAPRPFQRRLTASADRA